MSGGVVPGGICLSSVCEIAVICALASADVGARLEEHFDDAKAVIGIGLDMLDVVDRRRQCALRLRRDAAGHVLRREAGVLPDDRDHRNADVRKNIDRRAQRRQRADDENDQREHDERVGPPQRDADYSNHSCNAPKVTKSRVPAAQTL